MEKEWYFYATKEDLVGWDSCWLQDKEINKTVAFIWMHHLISYMRFIVAHRIDPIGLANHIVLCMISLLSIWIPHTKTCDLFPGNCSPDLQNVFNFWTGNDHYFHWLCISYNQFFHFIRCLYIIFWSHSFPL